MTKRLPANEPRCLAHDLAGKPNGCERADHCARHLAIRTDNMPAPITYRACSARGDEGYLSAAKAAA